MRRHHSLPPNYWGDLSSIWDANIQSPTFPFHVAYFEVDLWITSMLKGCGRALEIGCGTGGSTSVHRGETSHLVATDLSPDMVRRTRSNLARIHGQEMPALAVATIEHLPFRANTFDTVYGRGTALSYANDTPAALREIHRVLRPGGRVAVDTMNAAPLIESLRGRNAFQMMGETPVYQEVRDRGTWRFYRVFYLKPGDPWVRYCRKGTDVKARPEELGAHVNSSHSSRARYFRPHELKRLVESAGFCEVAIHPVGHLYYAQKSHNKWAQQFWKEHAEDLSRLFVELEAHLRPETAVSLVVTARKRGLSHPSPP
ncbi:MAG: class I SAM-dependent methyltransferase [Nitrososphaerota archaeon]|nr:class I SAM-dependent methyltransferase [Nitrososphaerota archaeon]